MATRETSRLKIPYPGVDDQGNWDAKFVAMLAQIDTRIFANLENLKPVYAALPTVTNDLVLGELQQVGDWVIVSRTFNARITVPNASVLTLQPDTMIGVRITAGAVANQVSAWETVPNGADIDAEFQVFGCVDASLNIFWYNGSVLAPGDVARLFQHVGGGGPGGETVKVTAIDPLAHYLDSKIAAGTNISTLVVGGGPLGEVLEISADGPGPVLFGAGNPNGVVPGNRGQIYFDVTIPGAEMPYINTTGAMVWFLV